MELLKIKNIYATLYNKHLVLIVIMHSGPGFNLFMVNLDYRIGPFKVDKYTSPGVSQNEL